VSLLRASAEHLPFADAVFDSVVMTWTLCSIANPVAALIEMRQVLKPGARLVFVEWAVPGDADCPLAAPADAMLEADRRGLSSRSQGGRLDPCCGVSDRSYGHRLYEGTETLDLHISGFGDELIMSGGPR